MAQRRFATRRANRAHRRADAFGMLALGPQWLRGPVDRPIQACGRRASGHIASLRDETLR
jgi:hypothetical protein